MPYLPNGRWVPYDPSQLIYDPMTGTGYLSSPPGTPITPTAKPVNTNPNPPQAPQPAPPPTPTPTPDPTYSMPGNPFALRAIRAAMPGLNEIANPDVQQMMRSGPRDQVYNYLTGPMTQDRSMAQTQKDWIAKMYPKISQNYDAASMGNPNFQSFYDYTRGQDFGQQFYDQTAQQRGERPANYLGSRFIPGY